VVPWLRKLGFSVQRARHGAELCSHMPDATLEERMKVALRGLAPNSVRRAAYMGTRPAGGNRADVAASEGSRQAAREEATSGRSL